MVEKLFSVAYYIFIAALATLGAIQTQGKRIAVLADMLELGTSAEKAHRAIGRALKKNGIDHVLAYGPLARHVVDAATSRVALHYDNKNVLAEHLKKLIAPGDVVLVKGSRGMQMEDIVTSLMDVHQTWSGGDYRARHCILARAEDHRTVESA